MPAVFEANPRRQDFTLSERDLAELCSEAAAQFANLKPFHQGESSEIRRTPATGLLIERLIPSLNSISRQRRGRIEGTERLRREISRYFWNTLHRHAVATCHLAYEGDYVLISEERIPPVEVIVKAAFIGTPARIYHGLFERVDRFGRAIAKHKTHKPYVRFDFKNPLHDDAGQALRDECMPPALAERFIDTEQATHSALRVFQIAQTVLSRLELQLLDACFLFDESGRVLCYEVSPDNMRIKRASWSKNPEQTAEFDKDLWRDGADPALLIKQWTALKVQLEQLNE